MKVDCPFCVPEKIASPIEYYLNDEVMVFEPLNPVTKGHLLVVPRVHIKDFTEYSDVGTKTFIVASQIAEEKGGAFNLITSKGIEATQTVNHLHLHLVPRRKNDNLHLPWTNQHKERG